MSNIVGQKVAAKLFGSFRNTCLDPFRVHRGRDADAKRSIAKVWYILLKPNESLPLFTWFYLFGNDRRRMGRLGIWNVIVDRIFRLLSPKTTFWGQNGQTSNGRRRGPDVCYCNANHILVEVTTSNDANIRCDYNSKSCAGAEVLPNLNAADNCSNRSGISCRDISKVHALKPLSVVQRPYAVKRICFASGLNSNSQVRIWAGGLS